MATTSPKQLDEKSRNKVLHYVSWACLIGGPIILAVPPRKLDLYTLGILFCIFASANEVSIEQTGISMIDRMGQRLARSTSTLPPQAIELQQRKVREENERLLPHPSKKLSCDELSPKSSREEALTGKKKKSSEFWHRVWMGDEGEDWKKERLRREREALESGKSYFDLIVEQVMDVWNNNNMSEENKTKTNEEKDFQCEQKTRIDVRDHKK